MAAPIAAIAKVAAAVLSDERGRKAVGILTEGIVNMEEGGLDKAIIGIGVNLKGLIALEIHSHIKAVHHKGVVDGGCEIKGAVGDGAGILVLSLPDGPGPAAPQGSAGLGPNRDGQLRRCGERGLRSGGLKLRGTGGQQAENGGKRKKEGIPVGPNNPPLK